MRMMQPGHKYSAGKHWYNHPTAYAEGFAAFLKENGFGGMLVDLGCGSGRDADVFHKAGFNALGVDISKEETLSASARFPGLSFAVQRAEQLGLKGGSVGAFFMINVIHYLDMQKALGEALRALEPGGWLFIHFNLEIADKFGNVDYSQGEGEILALLPKFNIVRKSFLERLDPQPVEHRHKIMELLLQKPG